MEGRRRDPNLPLFADRAARERAPASPARPAPRASKPAAPPSLGAPPSAPEGEPAERVVSVAQLGRRLRQLVEGATAGVLVEGEVTGLREVASGHAYFTLRDEREDASIDCVMYRTAPVRARRLLAEGARLVLGGRVTFYAPRGRAQLVVDHARLAGRGALLEALEKLRAKLAAEGLFDPSKKRALPQEPAVIGVVTSAEGAAVHDIIQVAFRRGPVRIVLAPAPVQGQGAATLMVRALEKLARHPEVEAIVLGRGGGSTDDLSAFNDEGLVRAVAACRVPVVTAVGHEVDVTLVDLAADRRAATPSQAAELLVPDARARLAVLAQLRARLAQRAHRTIDERVQRLDELRGDLRAHAERATSRRRADLARLERRLAARHPAAVLSVARAELGPLERRLGAAMERALSRRRTTVPPLASRLERAIAAQLVAGRSSLGRAAARLEAMSPLAVLARGYAIVRAPDGAVLRRASDVREGDDLDIRLAEGTVEARVRRVVEPE